MDHLIDGAGTSVRRRAAGVRRRRPGHVPPCCEPGQRLRLIKFVAYGWSGERSLPAVRDQVGAALDRGQADRLGRPGRRAARRTSTTSGAAPTSRSTATPRCSRRSGSRCSTCCRPARAARSAPIPAKGLTGPGYDGHAFWDTETFVLPVLTLTAPDAAASALRWRHTHAAARQRAGRPARPAGRGLPVADDPRRRSARATGRPARRPSTSTPTSPTRWSATSTPPATRTSSGPTGVELLVRDRAAVALARPPRRRGPVPHRRGHRPGRVQRDRRQQRLHQPDGPAEPAGGRRRGRAPPGPGPRARHRRRGDRRAGGTRPRRCSSRTTRRSACTRRPRAFTRHQVWDFAGTPRRPVPAAAALPVLRPVPQAGGQAGRPGARHAAARRRLHRRAEGPQLRLLRAR